MKVVDEKVLRFLEEAPLFFQPWWLEAVAPGAWDYVAVFRGAEVAALLPYTVKVRLNRLRLLEMPKLTPYLGPWLRKSEARYANRLGEEKALMTELIDALPPFATFQQNFHPSITNWLPFHWKGFEQNTLCTYCIEDTRSLEALWTETRDNVRTDIKKAKKLVAVEECQDIEEFLKLYRLTFVRQSKAPPWEDVIQRIDGACKDRHARKILIARGSDGRAHAGVYLLSDTTTVYYFFSGGDPELRNSGATSLLIWEGIRWASEQGKKFDFEGSMVEPIERFVRAFGGRQIPYLHIQKCPSRIVLFYRTALKLIRECAWR